MLYGRDRERAELWSLLESARASRSGALVLRGEAGAAAAVAVSMLLPGRNRASAAA
jgi:hypothetical protein